MEFWNFIVEKALVLIPVLVIMGMILKNTPKFPDWCIPWALLFSGVAFSGMMLGWTIEAILQGVLVAGAAVFGNQLVKQTKAMDSGA